MQKRISKLMYAWNPRLDLHEIYLKLSTSTLGSMIIFLRNKKIIFEIRLQTTGKSLEIFLIYKLKSMSGLFHFHNRFTTPLLMKFRIKILEYQGLNMATLKKSTTKELKNCVRKRSRGVI